ncbi:protein FAR1-RELATED SEQUENCE 5-like [Dioscorea cayenensis subsp. rotundata]|uniref:Protein FAR1-RELATED SEQUENCE n=1 Tax=Dioscorea cayennensis subsp. rotundata TaxID=55577 RepID=A0AB40CKF2_DIOCR|nr:protein FAR1-RELATED SEQUENCE 5-like [Dioscorea cayenensis subsp. rotundata]
MEPNGLDLLLSINPIDVVGSSVVANSVPQILVEESYAVESLKDGSLKMKSSVVGSFDWEYHSEENMIELDEGDENVNQCIYDMEKEKHVIYDYEDEASFLEAWENLLEKFNLRENPWLLKLFGERKKWAMVYGRHIFCGNMMSTQRSESFNSLLRNYLTSKLGVARFFEQFERVLEDRRYAELQEDYKMMDQSISSKELCPILRQMVQLYTPNIFQKLKEEHNKILYVMVELLSERNHSKTYKAIHVDAPHHASVVTFDSSNETIECSCKKFDFSGIPCMHMLRVLDVNQKFVLPSKYILKRWTRKARDIDTCIFVSTMAEEDPIVAKSKRYMDMCHRYQKLISEASKCEEAYKEVVRHYFVLDAKVKDIVKMSHSGREDCLSTDDVYNHNLTCDYSDARGLAIRHKPSRGGRSTKRIKGIGSNYPKELSLSNLADEDVLLKESFCPLIF